ncbi:nucleotide-binding oligomerization domain-containing protein 2-like [Trichomycterus rosablanca]|uniref:nucleotide-binding oligomerization domain-containing protein 2-like n=1 Tax=Trichomycterus rosablanca TaxID=2290929 RepID=UPI002F353119
MASSNQSAKEYVQNARIHLVGHLYNLPLIVEKLHQQGVVNANEVSEIEEEPEKYNKTRNILDSVLKKGEKACYQFLKILDLERKSVLPKIDPVSQAFDFHTWINLFSFRDEPDGDYVQVLDTDTEKNNLLNKLKLKSKKSKKPRSKKMRAYIPKDTDRKSPEDLLNSKEKNILLVGKPGIGKTTVLQQMLFHWAEGRDGQLDFLFYLDENTLSSTSTTASLENLLLGSFLMSNPKLRDNVEEISDYLQEYSEKVTLIVDGIKDFNENSILKRIMNHDLLPDAKIVATCRPEAEDDFSDWPTCKVYVQGFSEESIYDFFKQMPDHNPDLFNNVVNNPALFSLCHVPMYAFMVVACFSHYAAEGVNKQCTVSELYLRIFRHCVQKHGHKKLRQLNRYITDCRDVLLLLAESAFSATKGKTINFEFDYDEDSIASIFIRSLSDGSPAVSRTFCAFLHNTMQEFFSALWLLKKSQELDHVLQLCQTEEYKHIKQVISFLCGLQSETSIPLLKCLLPTNRGRETFHGFFEKFLNTFLPDGSDGENTDIAFICQCLFELQSPEACCSFLERTDYYLDLSNEHLDPYICCAVSFVISQSSNRRVQLDLENSVVSFTGLKTLFEHSRELSFTSKPGESSDECEKRCRSFKLDLCLQAALHQTEPIQTTVEKIFPHLDNNKKCELLLDLYSHIKQYEIKTGSKILQALLTVYQSVPAVWYINLSKRKASVLLEVLKLQPEKKPVELRGCSDEESEVRSFIQCLPYISHLVYR